MDTTQSPTARAFSELRARDTELTRQDALLATAIAQGHISIARYIAQSQASHCHNQARYSFLLKPEWTQERDRYRALAQSLQAAD